MRSTASNVLKCVNHKLQDFEKAFDRVDHFILMLKLQGLRTYAVLLRYIKSYVTISSQAVVVAAFSVIIWGFSRLNLLL